MASIETIAQRARELITSDEESVWLDLPQIINAVRPALSAFYTEIVKEPDVRSLFIPSVFVGEVINGELDLEAELPYPWLWEILDEIEMVFDDWPYPVRLVTMEELRGASALDALHIKACRENNKLFFSPDTTGAAALGGGVITAQMLRVRAPNMSLNVAYLPERLEGRFVEFLASYISKQILKRA